MSTEFSDSGATVAAPVYITIDQAAAALSVDPKTIRRKISAGELPAVRIGKRTSGSIRDMRPIRIESSDVYGVLEPIVVTP